MNATRLIQVSGEVDMNAAPRLRERFRGAFDRKQRVVADLSGVTYMDSAGVAVLVEAFQWSRRENVPFVLAAPSEAARSVIQLARLDQFFTISPTLEEVL